MQLSLAASLRDTKKKLGFSIDSAIVGSIFHHYKGTYENYTLLELIRELELARIEIQCAWNKRAIIEMIEDRHLNIAKKYEPMQPTKWEHHWRRPYFESAHKDIIYTTETFFDFSEGDIFQSAG